MDADTAREVAKLQMRTSVLEEILLRVYVSELATTATRSRTDAQLMAASNVETFAEELRRQMQDSSILNKYPELTQAFREHVDSLKASILKLR
jgi:hypothetical protein